MYVFSVSTGRRVNGRTGQKQSASKVVDILCLRKCIHNRRVRTFKRNDCKPTRTQQLSKWIVETKRLHKCGLIYVRFRTVSRRGENGDRCRFQ